jgi:hypothetical protein
MFWKNLHSIVNNIPNLTTGNGCNTDKCMLEAHGADADVERIRVAYDETTTIRN